MEEQSLLSLGLIENLTMTRAAAAEEAVIFLHVPKTAGTTLNRLIEWEYPLFQMVLSRSRFLHVVRFPSEAAISAAPEEDSDVQGSYGVWSS